MKPLFPLLLAFTLVLSCSSGVSTVLANENPTTVDVTFVGDNQFTPGFAECEITITPGENPPTTGYYLVYYTDGENLLAGYDEVTAVKVNNGNPVIGYVSHGIMLPPQAKGIAVFHHNTYYASKTLDINNAVATAPLSTVKQNPNLGKKHFSFGALSDTHMNYEQHNRGAYKKLENAMNFYAQQNMDAVIITGDVVGDRGETPDLEAQYEKHVEIINKSDFPLENVYESTGNHGNTPADVSLMDQYLGNEKEQHPYKNSPYYSVLFETEYGNDNLFIVMSQEMNGPSDSAAYDNFSKEQIDWLERLFQQYGNTNTNIFMALHSPFLKFGAGDIPNGTYNACIPFKEEYVQTMRLKALLETYKNTIVMSGHTHTSFYENANYSNLNGTFAHTVHIGSNSQPCAYGDKTSQQKSWDGRRSVSPTYGSEGYTVDVYENYIVYTGYNLSTGKIIPAAQFMIPTRPYDGPKEPEPEPEPNPEPNPETPTDPVVYSLGDVNSDQKVDAKDALWVLKYAVGKIQFTENQLQAAEVTGDGLCNAKDALEILKFSVSKIHKFPIEEKE